MNIHDVRFVRPALASLCAASLSILAACGGGGNGGMTSTVTLTGTAASGKALNGAAIVVNCSPGSATATADANGHYNLTLNGSPPCLMSASANGIMLHSLAFAGGTFNTTPQTDLLLVYLAAQLGTNEAGLVAGFASNTRFQQVLANHTNVLNAQTAVVTNLQQRYALTLAAPNFLTTPFTVGQPGVDSDLDALTKAGAIDGNGAPDAAAISLMAAAGAAQPLPATPATTPSSGGTGSTSGGAAGPPGTQSRFDSHAATSCCNR